jgi:hypothetical protein
LGTGGFAKLLPGDLAHEDGFGTTFAMTSSLLAVGAPGVDGTGLQSGAAYVFVARAFNRFVSTLRPCAYVAA